MDWSGIREALEKRSQLLRVVDVAALFDVHINTIENWVRRAGLPKFERIRQPRAGRVRYLQPPALLAWVKEQEAKAARLIGAVEISGLVGVHLDTFRDWVKQGRAPRPVDKELTTGGDLWEREEIARWHKELSGGFSFPRDPKPPRERRKRGAKRGAPRAARGTSKAAPRIAGTIRKASLMGAGPAAIRAALRGGT